MAVRSSLLLSTRRDFLIAAAAAPAVCAATPDKELVRVLSVPAGGIQPQVALDQDVLHLIYFAGDPKHGDVFYTRSDDFGRTFSSSTRVNSQAGSAIAVGAIRGAQISVGKRNRVHVAWNGSDAAEPRGPINPEDGKRGSPMLYTRLDDRGTRFEPQRSLMQRTFGLDGGGSVTADHSGNVYVGWHGKAPGPRKAKPAGRFGLPNRRMKVVILRRNVRQRRSQQAPADAVAYGYSPIPAVRSTVSTALPKKMFIGTFTSFGHRTLGRPFRSPCFTSGILMRVQ